MPSITIAICTHNGVSRIGRLLGALSRAGRDAVGHAEILIVDNASTDDTGSVVNGFRSGLPIRYEIEERTGLSHARNRALESARADLIAFTDDDCVVPANWAPTYIEAGLRYPDASFFGGDIVPLFPGASCAWVENAIREVPGAYAKFAVGGSDGKISPDTDYPSLPYGANFCLRRSRIGSLRFDPALGRRPGRLMSGEETGFIRELLARGESGWLVANNPVEHWIGPQRQSLRYIADYYRNDGRRRQPVNPLMPKPLQPLEFLVTRLAGRFVEENPSGLIGEARSMRLCRQLAQRLGSLEAAASATRRPEAG